MVTKRIIPCLDVRGGRVVKGVQFDHLEAVGVPWEAARRYEEEGADEVVLLDVDASLEGRLAFLETVERTAEVLSIPLAVGGGIRSLEDIRRTLRSGADKVSINTAALADPDLLRRAAAEFGSQCVVVAIDARRRSGGWEVHSHSGTRPTGIDARDWAARAEALGAGEVLLTSIDADGGKEGYDVTLTRAVAERVGVPVIASGGCGHPEHMVEVLTRGGADAALAASIFHRGLFRVWEVKAYLASRGVEVRGVGSHG